MGISTVYVLGFPLVFRCRDVSFSEKKKKLLL